MRDTGLPEYENPPLVEVVCGVTFDDLEGFTSAHTGVFWKSIRNEFPRVNELPPLAISKERFDVWPETAELITPTFHSVRQMFFSEDQSQIIQTQSNRFVYNWRKRGANEYPRFYNVYNSFGHKFEVFKSICDLTPKVVQYELTYVNQVFSNSMWTAVRDLGKIIPFVDMSFGNSELLSSPENLTFATNFALPDRMGRLYVVAKTGIDNERQERVMHLEFRVRGMAADDSLEMRDNWFLVARDWIVRGFSELTDENVQRNSWKRLR